MALHPLATHFDAVAHAYERGRPEYPPAVVGAIIAELGLASGASVLDLAAGTGKLTRALIEQGLDVIAVEPQPTMRGLLAESVGDQRVRDGVAESIPLPDGAVRAVTVADAFHWFDARVALAEMRRVTATGGGMAVLFANVSWEGASWAHEVGNLVAGVRGSHPGYDGPSWLDSLAQAGGWAQPRELSVSFQQPSDTARVLAHIASISWIAALEGQQREALLANARSIIDAGEAPAQMPVHVRIGLARAA